MVFFLVFFYRCPSIHLDGWTSALLPLERLSTFRPSAHPSMTAPTAATRLPIRMTTPLVAVGYGETANCRWHEETRGGEVAVVYKPAPRPVMCVGVRAMRGGTLFFDGSQLLGGWGIGHVLFGGLHAKIRRREVLRIHVCTCMYASYCIAYGLMIHVSMFSSINCLCFPW